MFKRFLQALALAAGLVALSSPAHADALGDIKKAKVIKIAVPQDFPPFGSVGKDMKPQGYDIDVASHVISIGTAQVSDPLAIPFDRIKALLPSLQSALPGAVTVSLLTDRTNTIRASVEDVEFELVLAIGLVVMVVFLFLRRLAATIAAGVTVPLALSGTCAAMWVAGFSIDNISLMALAVSVGFVVDDDGWNLAESRGDLLQIPHQLGEHGSVLLDDEESRLANKWTSGEGP